MIGYLPRSLNVNGTDYLIDSDYRNILTIFEAYAEPEYTDDEKTYIMFTRIYEDYESIPEQDIEEALKKAILFMDCGKVDKEEKNSPKIMDWKQDEQMIFSAINKVAGKETRGEDYLHWWTFMGFFNEIGEGLFSTVTAIRSKKATHQKLEKHEQKFYSENKNLVNIKIELTEEEKAQKEYFEQLLK